MLILDGRHLARVEAENRSITNAWLAEAFARKKRLPKLESVLVTGKESNLHDQSPEDMVAVLQQLKDGGANIDLKFTPYDPEELEET